MIKNENECYQYVPNEYRAYLKAKDEGVKKKERIVDEKFSTKSFFKLLKSRFMS